MDHKTKRQKCQVCPRRRNYYCQAHAEEYQKVIRTRATCPGWGNEKPPNATPVKNMAVISCYFNPLNDPRLFENYRRFLADLGQPAQVVELSFNGEFHNPAAIQVKGDPAHHLMWQKEYLLNIALKALGASVDAVAWIDADLLFKNPRWYQEAAKALEQYYFVQLFDAVEYQGPTGLIEETRPGWAVSKNRGMPGGAWAARLEDMPAGGFPGGYIVGGGDWGLINSWPKDSRVGHVSGAVTHLDHGPLKARQWSTREAILTRHQFDKDTDIKTDPAGLCAWATAKPELHAAIKEYFQARTRRPRGPRPGISATLKNTAAPALVDPPAPGLQVVKVTAPVHPSAHRRQYWADVVIPYNGPNYEYLADSIKSVLNQNFVGVLVHLINDGMAGPDPVGEEFNRLDNVLLYRNIDGPVGPYVSLNRVFDHLKYDHFANQDSDDLSTPMRLYKSFEVMARGFDIVGGAMEQFTTYSDKNPRMRKALSAKPYHYSGIKRFGSPSGNIVNSTALISKSIYEKTNGMAPWVAGADSEYYERAIRSGARAAAIDEILAHRRLHGPSLSNDQVTTGHGSEMRDEIKRKLKAAQVGNGFNHDIGGLARHRNDKELVIIRG